MSACELRTVCVYCGSADGTDPAYGAMAEALGAELAAQGIALVYGGAKVGLMGTVADAVLAGGGHVTGVIPQGLVDLEVAHDGLPDLRVVGSMHERKLLMAELADGFLALPGGVGTIEEVIEAVTWTQLRIQDKPVALLDVLDYWAHLEALLDHALASGFVRPQNRGLLLKATDPREALDTLRGWTRPTSA